MDGSKPVFGDIKSWTGRTVHGFRSWWDNRSGTYWIEQNRDKDSEWAAAAKRGHEIAWEFAADDHKAYTGRVLLDGQVLTVDAARRKLWGIDR